MSCIAPACAAAREPGSLFCRKHELEPKGRRGGWVSAWNRNRKLAQMDTTHEKPDISNIVKRLWVGSAPSLERDYPDFDVIALCAAEHQPAQGKFHGDVFRCTIPDSALSNYELRKALVAGRQVGQALYEGKRVLVTCHAGLNRSCLVAGLGMGITMRMSALQIVELVRERRAPACLSNPHFVEYLTRFIGDGSKPHWTASR